LSVLGGDRARTEAAEAAAIGTGIQCGCRRRRLCVRCIIIIIIGYGRVKTTDRGDEQMVAIAVFILSKLLLLLPPCTGPPARLSVRSTQTREHQRGLRCTHDDIIRRIHNNYLYYYYCTTASQT